MTSATFLYKEQLSDSLFTFWFAPEKQLKFIAGQFTQIKLPHDQPDSRGQQRWFSLSSDPNDTNFSITTRVLAEQSSSFKTRLLKLSPGDTILAADTMGDFVLPKKATVPLVWIAAGVGIAPFISMALTNKNYSGTPSIDLFWTTNYDELLPHHTLFTENTSDITIFEKGNSLTAASITGKVSTGAMENGLFYIAGPEKFVESMQAELVGSGLPASRVIADYFDGY